MPERWRERWAQLRDGLWFLPAAITLACAALALLTVRIDETGTLGEGRLGAWLYGGGAEGARGVLSAIASTMVTVTALVFSITVVALQLASSQLTPRVLRSFIGDRGNQVVLGAFIGTFTYALLTLRVVRSPLEDRGGFVPALSVSVAIALAMLSVGLLIYFVHHAADSMRAASVIDRVAAATIAAAERAARERATLAKAIAPANRRDAPKASLETIVAAERAGYLRAVHRRRLLTAAERSGGSVRVAVRVGAFILPGESLAVLESAAGNDERIAGEIRGALPLGPERNPEEDVAFGLTQLADIAIRALSPGVNDPTTAMQCLDRIGEVLLHVARLRSRDDAPEATRGLVTVSEPTFADLVAAGFGAVAPHAAGDRAVAACLASTARRVAALAPDRAAPLLAVAAEADPAAAVPSAAVWRTP